MPIEFARTPWDAIPATAVKPIDVGLGPPVLLEMPADPGRLLDHPEIERLNLRDQYMPYWGDVWPSALMLAETIRRTNWGVWAESKGLVGVSALELGCGLGLAGLAAMHFGIHVTFSDYDLTALEFCERSARHNGFGPEDYSLLPIDWRDPPSVGPFPLVFGSDLIYEGRNVPPLVDCLGRMLGSGGLALISDQDRTSARAFREALAAAGFSVVADPALARQEVGPDVAGTVYRVTRAG